MLCLWYFAPFFLLSCGGMEQRCPSAIAGVVQAVKGASNSRHKTFTSSRQIIYVVVVKSGWEGGE